MTFNLDDIKDQIVGRLQNLWAELQDHPTFISAKERYDLLPIAAQKTLVITLILLVGFFILSMPLADLKTAEEQIKLYQETKNIIKQLHQMGRMPTIEPEPLEQSAVSVQARVATILNEANLLPEQILGTAPKPINLDKLLVSENAKAIGVRGDGLGVRLAQLSLRQIVDLSFRFQTMSPRTIVLNMSVRSHDSKETGGHFFDTEFDIVTLAANVSEAPPERPENPRDLRDKKDKADGTPKKQNSGRTDSGRNNSERTDLDES